MELGREREGEEDKVKDRLRWKGEVAMRRFVLFKGHGWIWRKGWHGRRVVRTSLNAIQGR